MRSPDHPATARLQPLIALFCIVGIACAVFAVVARSRAQTPRRVTTVSIATAPALVVGGDDCPLTETCAESGVRAASVSAVLAAFPGGTLTNDLTHGALAGAQSLSGRRLHREVLDVRTSAGVLISVVSRCVDQGSGVHASQSSPVLATGPAAVFVVVPGRAGCSAGVILQVPAGVVVPWKAAVALAHRPELQLPG